MIKIEMTITYDKPLSESEEKRIAEAIRRVLQPTVAQAACSQVQDGLPPEYEPRHIRSQFLNIDTSIMVRNLSPDGTLKVAATEFGIDLTKIGA